MFQTAEQLELDHLALALLLSAELEVLGPLDGTLKQDGMTGRYKTDSGNF